MKIIKLRHLKNIHCDKHLKKWISFRSTFSFCVKFHVNSLLNYYYTYDYSGKIKQQILHKGNSCATIEFTSFGKGPSNKMKRLPNIDLVYSTKLAN